MNTKVSTTEKLTALLNDVREARDSFLGYPVSKDFNYEPLYEFLQYPINNLGILLKAVPIKFKHMK